MQAQLAIATQVSLHVNTLGPFRIERRCSLPGEPICFAVLEGKALGDRPGVLLALLKVLLCSEQRHATKAYLADALWPEADEESALRSLRTTKNELSKVLRTSDGRCLLFETPDGSGLYLASQAEIEVDADRFEAAVQEAAQAEGTNLPAQSLQLWKHAYDLWQGTYLPGDLDRRWAESRRLELESLYSLCVQRLSLLYRTCDQTVEAERVLRRYWSTHLTDEEMLFQLMELTATRGKRLIALRFYQESVRALREELGVSPSEQIRTLAEQIRKQGIAQSVALTAEQHFPYRLAANGLLLLGGTTMPSSSLAEGPKDIPTLFGEWAACLMQFVLRWNGRALHCEKLQRVLNQELERWNTMTNLPHEALISRRTVLAALAALPLAMVPAILQGQRSPLVVEEFLPECTASLTACWHLMQGDGLATVAEQLPHYLPALEVLAKQPSRYQKTAAQLAAQGCLLMGLIALHHLNVPQREDCCRRAVHYSHIAEDQTLYVTVLGHLADTLSLENRPTEAQQLHKQLLTTISDKSSQITPLLKSKVLIESAASYAQSGQVQNALRWMNLAHEVFPGQTHNDPVYLSTDHGPYLMLQWAGQAYSYLGKYTLEQGMPRRSRVLYAAAQTAFAQLGKLDAAVIVPERIRVEMLNQQAATSIAQADLDTFQTYLQVSVEGAKALGSEKRKQEAIANWRAARQCWPHEQRILELADLLI